VTVGKDILSELYCLKTKGERFYCLTHDNDFDISWLEGRLGAAEYRRLENAVLEYSRGNEETLFRMGFQCALELLMCCLQE